MGDGDEQHHHEYRTELAWNGSTAKGYDDYEREHWVRAEPSDAELTLSSDPAFRGDPRCLNPEQLVVAAASSCQLLSFLAVAARARVDVVEYHDNAVAFMPEDQKPMRITRIELRPQVVVRASDGGAAPTDERLAHLTEVAHRECFIANSLASEVVVSPRFFRE